MGIQIYHSRTSLTKIELDAIQTVAYLSTVPRRILETYGSYKNFKKATGDVDMVGIEYAEFRPIQIVYNGGLQQFVNALELKRNGREVNLDSSLHELQDSLDKGDHFTKLFETLEKYKDEKEKLKEE